jgi:hypothetical protein
MSNRKMINMESNWIEEYNKPREDVEQKAIFKIKLSEGEIAHTEKIVFLSEGEKKTTKYGDAIVFNIANQNEEKTWFIRTNQYDLLNAIARQKKVKLLAQTVAEVTRTGKEKTDTRWGIKF